MSRNLCETRCQFCDADEIVLEETPRPITEADAGRYFHSFEGMIVANAICPVCEAKYLAWIDQRTCTNTEYARSAALMDMHFFDLSFRSTFNDEPGPDDMPRWDTEGTAGGYAMRLRAALTACRDALRDTLRSAPCVLGDWQAALDRANEALGES